MSKNRDLVFKKYDGKCAYCGTDLVKGWHVDHLAPVNRTTKYKDGYYRHKITKEKIDSSALPNKWYSEYEYIKPKYVFDKMLNPENDTMENSIPSCQSCNLYKSSMDIEVFRQNIGELIRRLNGNITQYKIAKRYGLVIEDIKPVVFYFETKVASSTRNPEL